jgi:hypothetical protein
LREGQAGSGAARDGATVADGIDALHPNGLYGSLCNVLPLTGPVSGCDGLP